MSDSLKRLAGEAFNIMPDRMNLFLRYMSGVGNEGLKLDDSTLRSIRQATEQPDKVVDYIDPEQAAREIFVDNPEMSARFLESSKSPIEKTTYKYGPNVPTSGPVDPYILNSDKAVTQTLGRFVADVNDDGSIRVTDTYDMLNEAEDPDLVSGSFRPDKALLKLQGLYDPEARAKLFNQILVEQGKEPTMMRPPMDNRSYQQKIKTGGDSPTGSPLSQVARAAMYLAPYKPQPFDIDITVPPQKY